MTNAKRQPTFFPFKLFLKRGAIIGHNGVFKLFTSPISSTVKDATLSIISFYGSSQRHYRFDKTVWFTYEDLKNKIQNITTSSPVIKKENTDINFVKDIEDYLANPESVTKFVSCTRETIQHSKSLSPELFLQSFLSEERNGYLYGMWNEEEGFIGITPEPSLLRTKNDFTTFSIAGTSKSKTKDLDTLKLKDEQEQVSIQIRSSLSKLKIDSLSESDSLLDANGITHRQTKFNFTADENSFLDILSVLTPTGALGVVPKSNLNYLENTRYFNLDKNDRCFGGNFVYSNGNEQTSLVMIRSVQWLGKLSWIDSGCGITPLSTPEEELSEAILKRQKVKEIFYG